MTRLWIKGVKYHQRQRNVCLLPLTNEYDDVLKSVPSRTNGQYIRCDRVSPSTVVVRARRWDFEHNSTILWEAITTIVQLNQLHNPEQGCRKLRSQWIAEGKQIYSVHIIEHTYYYCRLDSLITALSISSMRNQFCEQIMKLTKAGMIDDFTCSLVGWWWKTAVLVLEYSRKTIYKLFAYWIYKIDLCC